VIFEYAVEPALVAQWARDGEVGLAGQFGLDQRRVVSDFPRDWEGEVATALLEEFGYDAGDPDYLQASAFLNALLAFMNAHMIDRGLKLQQDRPWLDQALEVHAQEPFYAILTRTPVAGHSSVITETIVDQLRDARWYLPTVKSTAKTGGDLAATLAPLLRGATKIVVVDPFFDPRDPSYREVLTALLVSAAQLRGPGRSMPSVEIVTGVGEGRPDGGTIPVETQLANAAWNRCEWAAQHLGPCIPKGMQLTFQCAASFPDGDRLHNRFLLTDFAGASLPYGTQALGARVFDDISPLYQGQYEKRWRQFTGLSRLHVIGTPRVIDGLCQWPPTTYPIA
jgi:hypothetical protein